MALRSLAIPTADSRETFKASDWPVVGLPLGADGEFCAAHGKGRDRPPHIADHNRPPWTQPGLNYGWAPSPDGSVLVIAMEDGFIDFKHWLDDLATHFFAPWGYRLNGEISFELWEDEISDMMTVKDNRIEMDPDLDLDVD